jgi:hypothetical protein
MPGRRPSWPRCAGPALEPAWRDTWAALGLVGSLPEAGRVAVDEAYQMSSAALVRVGALFDRLLLVGNPGQLAPFTVSAERGALDGDLAAGHGRRHDAAQPPVDPVVPLPVSWRLPPSAAPVVSAAFYARLPGMRRPSL